MQNSFSANPQGSFIEGTIQKETLWSPTLPKFFRRDKYPDHHTWFQLWHGFAWIIWATTTGYLIGIPWYLPFSSIFIHTMTHHDTFRFKFVLKKLIFWWWKSQHTKISCLVVWNMNFIFHNIWECHHPNWRTDFHNAFIFFRGVGQPPTRIMSYPIYLLPFSNGICSKKAGAFRTYLAVSVPAALVVWSEWWAFEAKWSNTLWLCQNSYWKSPFIVSFPMKNGGFP